MTTWRVCRDGKGRWWYCQEVNCPNEHHPYSPFYGISQTVGKWEGIKHK